MPILRAALVLTAVVATALVPAYAGAQMPSDASQVQGIAIPVTLDQKVSSDSAKVGEKFTFTTAQTVQVGDVTIPKGAQGQGVVASARTARWDRGGELALQVESIDLSDGRTIAVSAGRAPKPNGHNLAGEAGKAAQNLKPSTALPIALVPLALPVGGAVVLGSALHILKGHNVTFSAGAQFTVIGEPPAPK